jgi:hypothetical protein
MLVCVAVCGELRVRVFGAFSKVPIKWIGTFELDKNMSSERSWT